MSGFIFLCQDKVCSPFSCKAYYHKCKPETKAMRRVHDELVAMHAGATGYACDVCKKGGVQGNLPGWICPDCAKKHQNYGDLF